MSTSVSVLLPVRDGQATIARAIRSTLAALPSSGELLVHDDASSDGTAAVLASFKDRRLRVTAVDRSVGVAAALNGLLAEARGPYIARIDADDVTLPGRFARQLRAVRGGADFVFAGHVRFGSHLGAFRQKRGWGLSPETLRLWLALENPLTHPTMFGRTDVLRAAGGYRPGPAEDYDLWLRLSTAGARLRRLALPGIGYRMHSGQVTSGRGYLARVLADDGLRRSHDAHSRSVGWSGPEVWPFLWLPAQRQADQAAKDRFHALLVDGARRLPPFEGMLLRQAIRRSAPGSTAAGWYET